MEGNRSVRFEKVPGSAIRYKNFSGTPGDFNNEGERSFCLFVDNDVAEDLKSQGYNIRYRKPREDDEDREPIPYLPIKVNFESRRPPQINQVTSNGVVKLDKETVGNLDWADIIFASISINPYHWNFAGKEGITAYLNEMLVEIEDESFLSRYLSDRND